MKKTKICKNCNEIFEARRTNHIYCTSSCKTKASYKRNNYKYVSGHYQKMEVVPKPQGLAVPLKSEIIESLKALKNKIDHVQKSPNINKVSVTNAALGTAASDATVFALKKMLAPNSLPATKGDLQALKNELNELKKMILDNNLGKISVF